MKYLIIALSPFLFVGGFANADSREDQEADAGHRIVKARTLSLQVPEAWKDVELSSESRVAQFSIPNETDGSKSSESNPEHSDMVVFYFGGPTGGVKANVERWIGQFEKEGLKLHMFQGECAAGNYILIDTQGTWNKPDGPPFARKTIATPNARALNVIIKEIKNGQEDYYFIKLSGHEDAVANETNNLRVAIGAKLKTETKFELK